ncbi:hypothetical protein AB0B86_08875 [Micromonospora sp. NPDC049047]|uniref:hypothetical protein n=1 Tax=Micromonospora sp. NPDC049047 TaxID=3155645 RepID=UPI0033F475A4
MTYVPWILSDDPPPLFPTAPASIDARLALRLLPDRVIRALSGYSAPAAAALASADGSGRMPRLIRSFSDPHSRTRSGESVHSD